MNLAYHSVYCLLGPLHSRRSVNLYLNVYSIPASSLCTVAASVWNSLPQDIPMAHFHRSRVTYIAVIS